MHRNMLSTRLENQEGRDRLKCLAIYVHQKTSSDKSMKDGVQNTWDSLELGSQKLKEWRGYVEIGQQYTLAKRELLPIFFVCIQIWRDGVNFCIFSTFLSIYYTFASYNTKICATLLKERNLKNGANK